jgi:ATP-dependent Clp protease protease subunit
MIIPTVKFNGEAYSDIFSTLLNQGIVIVQGPITSELAMSVNAQLLYLDSQGTGPIEMYIDSPGGSISAGLSIIDMMGRIKREVRTICCGQAASMGAVIFSSGAQRFMLPHSECMIHQPSTGFEGKESDIRIVADYITRKKEELIDILAQNCNQARETVRKEIECDNYMTAEESVAFGLADKILN